MHAWNDTSWGWQCILICWVYFSHRVLVSCYIIHWHLVIYNNMINNEREDEYTHLRSSSLIFVWIQNCSGTDSSPEKEDEYVGCEGPASYWTPPPTILKIYLENFQQCYSILNFARSFQNNVDIINDVSNEL